MWVNVSLAHVQYAYLQQGKSARESSRPISIAVTHKRQVEKAEALLKDLVGILKTSSDQKANRTCKEAVQTAFWTETGSHPETMILEEYWKEKKDGKAYRVPEGERETYAVMVTATRLIMRYAKYKNGANRLIDLLKGSLISNDPKAERAMTMEAFDTVQKSELLELLDGEGPFDVSQISAEEDPITNFAASPLKSFIVDVANNLEMRAKGIITDNHKHIFTLLAKNLAAHFKEAGFPKDGKLPKDFPLLYKKEQEVGVLEKIGIGDLEVVQTIQEGCRKYWYNLSKMNPCFRTRKPSQTAE